MGVLRPASWILRASLCFLILAGAHRAYAAGLRFVTTSMPIASTNTFYDVQLQVADASGPVTFSVTAGALPPGMSLDPNTGYVSGRPTVVNASGTAVTFTATDGVSTVNFATKISVTATGGGGNTGVTFTLTSLPQGTVGTAYSVTITVSGGVGPFIFGADGLPPGLTLSGTTGAISGTPTAAGTFSVLLSVTDEGENNNKVTLALPLVVLPADGTKFQFTNLTIPGGEVGGAYSFQLSTSGGSGGVSFAATNLPPGLAIDAGTGKISGTPAAGSAGTFLVVISATSGADTITFNTTMIVLASATSQFYWNFSGLPAALVGVDYSRQPPLLLDTRNPGPGPVSGLTYSAVGLPSGITYNASTGELTGAPVQPGLYPVTFTATDSSTSTVINLSLTFVVLGPKGGDTNNLAVNFWVVKQAIKKGKKPGTDSWQAQYIYNADRTTANIFDSTKDALVVKLGSSTSNGNVIDITPPAHTLTGKKPKLSFKSAKNVKPAQTLQLDESAETIKLTSKDETDNDTFPNVLTNTLTLGHNGYKLEEFFDAKGTFTPTSGLRKTAFVVTTAKLTAKAAGKDSAQYNLLLGVPNFTFPISTTSNGNIHFTVMNGTTVVIDKDLTKLVKVTTKTSKSGGTDFVFKSTKDTSKTNALAKFSYDSASGKMQIAFKGLTLTGVLPSTSSSGLHTGVDIQFLDKDYFTGITIFAPKAGSYSTKLP